MCKQFEKIVFDPEMRWEIPPENQDLEYPFEPEMIQFKLDFDQVTRVKKSFFRRLKELLDQSHGNLETTLRLAQSASPWLDPEQWFDWMASFYEEKVLRLTIESERRRIFKSAVGGNKRGSGKKGVEVAEYQKYQTLLAKSRAEGRWGEGTFSCKRCGSNYLTEKEAEVCCLTIEKEENEEKRRRE